MPPYRDVAEFNDRAPSYDDGWRGRLHREIVDRTASLALATAPAPNRILDVGCGTGYLGVAEQIGSPDDTFELIVSTTSFDHWSDQQAGLRECARVLRRGGQLVLVDQFSRMLMPTMLTSRRGKARTRSRATRLLLRAGFCSPQWHRLHAVIINAATATKLA
jgi:ubiquinone/menaquinone biosynthesis C-methylase UbiE